MTTFIVMSYIIFVNPAILGFAGVEGLQEQGLPFNAVLTSTCLVAGVMTIIMGLYTNMAYAIAPGLGLNAVVAFTLVAQAGLSFPEAMGLVVVEGLAVTILVLVGLREAIMRAIPLELKKAIAIGIGLFIAFIGLDELGARRARHRHARRPRAVHDLAGDHHARRDRGHDRPAGHRLPRRPVHRDHPRRPSSRRSSTTQRTSTRRALGYARWPDDIFESPDFSLVGEFSFDAFSTLPFIAALAFAFSLFLADFFDTMGTLVGVGRQAGYVDAQGEMPEIRKPLLVDSVAAAAGGSVSGVVGDDLHRVRVRRSASAAGPAGSASSPGALFFPFMFIAPLIGMVPPQATAPALLIVAWLMISVLTEVEEEAEESETGRAGSEEATTAQPTRTTRRRRKLAGIDFHDLALGLSAAIVIMFMPFSFSITDGIAAGFIVYVFIRVFQGAWNTVHPLMWGAAIAFAIYFAIPIMQQEFSWI